jgi:hypothetical protein
MFTSIALLSIFALGGVLSENAQPVTLPQSIQQGEFDLAIPAAQAFPLFSPEGERAWGGAHWNPRPIYPAADHVRWRTNSVWTTEGSGESLTWWTLNVDRTSRIAEYLNMSPDRASRITVHVTETNATSCHVDVTYIMTATKPSGAEYVQQATADQMKHKMLHWKQSIDEAIAKGLPSIPE